MINLKASSSYIADFEFMLKNDLRLIATVKGNSDLYGTAGPISDSFKLYETPETKKIVLNALAAMDNYVNLYKAVHVKYRLNIVSSKNGFKFYQLKGAIGYDNKKKVWVNISLGNEEKVKEKYGTLDKETLMKENQIEMIFKAYKKICSLRKK